MPNYTEVQVNGVDYMVHFSREWVTDYSQGHPVKGYDYHFYSVAELDENNDWVAIKPDRDLAWKIEEQLDEVN